MKKNFTPKVSIVIPVYNGSNYLKEAIDSALSQTYKNIEIIVINDGSNDKGKTDKICKSYGNKIRYYKKENGGVSSALNMGIEKMEGEYFSWLSHDDVYYPDKIEKQITFLSELKEKEKVVLYADYELIDKDGKFLQNVYLKHDELNKKPEYALLRGSVNGITLLIPKSAFDEYGEFDETLKCTQDYDMWRRIAKGYKFVHMDEIFTKTRIHPLQDSNKHPNVVKEGDLLWINMMEQISDEDKKRLEGALYNFYREMYNFLESNSPYDGAKEHAKKKMQQIIHKDNKVIQQTEENCKVSVIIPFYNNGIDELNNALESIKNQSHKNFEILLINDGSTIDVREIEKIAKENKKLRYYKNEQNRGPGFARNLGITKATGEYICFLDADDVFLPEKLKKQLTEMLLTGRKISHTSYIQKENSDEEVVRSGKLDGEVIPVIIQSCTIATPTVMIKTNFLKENDFRFREDIQVGEDTCFWLEILRNEKLQGIDKPLTIVNKMKDSASTDLQKHLTGLSNILSYICSDEEYKKYHARIAYLCQRYVEVSEKLTTLENQSKKGIKKDNKVVRMFQLFRYQGVRLTLKKAVRKYVPKVVRKMKRLFR